MSTLADKRILVTGGAGFVGSHVVDHLLAEPVAAVTVLDSFYRGRREHLQDALRDPRVRVVEGSILDVGVLTELTAQADHVVHLAALSLAVGASDPRRAVEHNVMGTFNVIEAAQRAGVGRVVFSSSASVYGEPLTTPMTEEHPFNNRTVYGATKIAGEQLLRAFHELHGLDYVALRYMNVYGERMDDKGTYVSVIRRTLDRIARGESPVIHGDGSQAYDFVHVSDVARANVLALKAMGVSDRSYNVCTGVRTSLARLVAMLLELTGSDLAPRHEPGPAGVVAQRLGCPRAAREELGFVARVGLHDGLRALAAAAVGGARGVA